MFLLQKTHLIILAYSLTLDGIPYSQIGACRRQTRNIQSSRLFLSAQCAPHSRDVAACAQVRVTGYIHRPVGMRWPVHAVKWHRRGGDNIYLYPRLGSGGGGRHVLGGNSLYSTAVPQFGVCTYNRIGRPVRTHTKSICRETERATYDGFEYTDEKLSTTSTGAG